MNPTIYRLFLAYGIAIAATAIALLLTLWLAPWVDRTIGAFFYIAVVFSTWYGGLRPGIVTIVLSVLALNYYFIHPVGSFWATNVEDLFRLSIFGSVALIISLLTGNLKESKRKVEQLSHRLQDESSDRLKTALTAAQMGMWDWNIVTGEITWSPEHEHLLGLAPGTFDGRYETFDTCLHPDDREGLNQTLEQALNNRVPYHHEYRVIWADGSIHWVEGRGHAFYNEAGHPVRMSGTIMAIDARKQAQAVLQEREGLLRLFAQYAPAGIAMLDRHMRYVMASQQWVDDYALTSVEALIGHSHYEVFPEIPDRWRQIHQRCLAGAIEKCDADLFIRADGTQQWLSWEIRPWQTVSGDIGGIIIFAVNVTSRKQAEIALQELNAQLEQRVTERTTELTIVNDRLLETLMEQHHTQLLLFEQAQLLDLAHDTIITCDLNFVITFWNQGAVQTYGWSKKEALGKETYTLLKTQFPSPVAAIQTTLFEQGYWEGELVHYSRDDRPLTVLSRWVLQTDEHGRPLKILEINTDITARKQAEQALQQYTYEVEDLYNNAPCGYHSLNGEGVLIRVNDTELKWLGYTREELLHKKKFVDLLTPENQHIFYENFPKFKQQGWINNLEVEILRKDGTSFWGSLNATAMRDENGKFVMSRSTLFDISERRKMEQIKQDFISVVSHELRTPLTAIRGSLSLVAGGVYDKKPEKAKEMIGIAARQSDRLMRLVNDILDLRRLESGQTKFHFKSCLAADLIQQSVDVMRSLAEQNHIQLAVRPTNATAWADGDAIVQTLTNLLSNAIKFSPPNSTITLTATPNRPSPDLHSSATPFETCFCIQDQGRGIPTEQLETIFGQFQQVDASDSREKGGTGLGLAICRTIIEQHNGKIWAESVAGQGSTFYFSIPATGISIETTSGTSRTG